MPTKCSLFSEDCFDTMKRMCDEGKKVDIILTSPPYNMTKRKGGISDTGRYDVYEDWKSEEEYLDWTVKLFNMFNKILGKNKTILYNFSYSIENPSLPCKLVVELEKKTDFMLIDTIIWKKKSGIPFPANKRRLSRNWENVFVFVRKNEIDTYDNNRNVKSVSEKTGQSYYEVVYNFIEAKNNDGACKLNQATYSSELCEKLLSIYAKDGYTVYDPFMGTGTTAVACENIGTLNCIGSEISEAQTDYAYERLRYNNQKD